MALGFKNIYFSILQVCIKLPVYINADFRQSKDVHFISETFSLIKLVTSMSRQRRRGICQKSMQFKYNLINIRMNKRNKRGFSPSPSYRKPPPFWIALCICIRLEMRATDSCMQQNQNQSAFLGI